MSIRARKAWRPRPSAIPHAGLGGRLRCRRQADRLPVEMRNSTPAPMPAGGRPSRRACRCMPAARIWCRMPKRAARPIFTNCPPSGAFRGFGVPQSAIASEAAMDALADAVGMDWLEFRRVNALRPGDATITGQVLEDSSASWRPSMRSSPIGATGTRRPSFQRHLHAPPAGRWHRLFLVRHRQHLAQQPVRDEGGDRCGRPHHALLRRGRYRPRLEHHPDPDRGGRARRFRG